MQERCVKLTRLLCRPLSHACAVASDLCIMTWLAKPVYMSYELFHDCDLPQGAAAAAGMHPAQSPRRPMMRALTTCSRSRCILLLLLSPCSLGLGIASDRLIPALAQLARQVGPVASCVITAVQMFHSQALKFVIGGMLHALLQAWAPGNVA